MYVNSFWFSPWPIFDEGLKYNTIEYLCMFHRIPCLVCLSSSVLSYDSVILKAWQRHLPVCYKYFCLGIVGFFDFKVLGLPLIQY